MMCVCRTESLFRTGIWLLHGWRKPVFRHLSEGGLALFVYDLLCKGKPGSDMRKRLMMPVVGLELSYTVHARGCKCR